MFFVILLLLSALIWWLHDQIDRDIFGIRVIRSTLLEFCSRHARTMTVLGWIVILVLGSFLFFETKAFVEERYGRTGIILLLMGIIAAGITMKLVPKSVSTFILTSWQLIPPCVVIAFRKKGGKGRVGVEIAQLITSCALNTVWWTVAYPRIVFAASHQTTPWMAIKHLIVTMSR